MAPCIDLFASYRHHQLPRYYSAYEDDPEALGQNAFAYEWDPWDDEASLTEGKVYQSGGGCAHRVLAG